MIERARGMGVEIVLDKAHPLAPGIMALDEIAQKVRIIHGRALSSDLDVPKPRLGFKGKPHPTGAVPFIFILHAPGLSRFHR